MSSRAIRLYLSRHLFYFRLQSYKFLIYQANHILVIINILKFFSILHKPLRCVQNNK